MKNIILLILCLPMLGCTKSHTEVEEARVKCASIGGKLIPMGELRHGVITVFCEVDGITYREGKF